jgi:hypothetical protein
MIKSKYHALLFFPFSWIGRTIHVSVPCAGCGHTKAKAINAVLEKCIRCGAQGKIAEHAKYALCHKVQIFFDEI